MATKLEELRKDVTDCEDPYHLAKGLFYSQMIRSHVEMFVRWHTQDQTSDPKTVAKIMDNIFHDCIDQAERILKAMRSAKDLDHFQSLLSVFVGSHAAAVLRPHLTEFSTVLSTESIAESLIAHGREREVINSIVELNTLTEGFLSA